jgi:hypothetical protein
VIFLLGQEYQRILSKQHWGDDMKKLVGLYHLRLLWLELQKIEPDENGNILFNLERFKRIHDIAPDATAIEENHE